MCPAPNCQFAAPLSLLSPVRFFCVSSCCRLSATACAVLLLGVATVLAVDRDSTVIDSAGNFDSRVVFDNGRSDHGHIHSEATLVAPSELELRAGRIPLASARFVSPPNALRLHWKSAPGGDWRATLKVATRYGRRFEFVGDTLSLSCFSEEGLAVDDAPRIFVQDTAGTA